jgi:prevent-host-death family protein
MPTFNMHEAKTNLSKLVELANKGEEVILAKNGKPMVRLTPLARKEGYPPMGDWQGKVWMSDDFNDPLPDEYTGFD